MKIDVLARAWGSPEGGSNGMAIAAAYFAHTLEQLGHQVRRLGAFADASADLVITTITQTWRRTVQEAQLAGVRDRLVYWHHASGVPQGFGCILAAAPSIEPTLSWWSHRVALPPSSWAAEAGGECIGSEVLVAGASPAKGGHVALEVARRCPDLRWLVLAGRSAATDRAPWRELPTAEALEGVMAPAQFLARARVVLAPTRFESYGLLLVEAAMRGIPVVCTDLLATRSALGDYAIYLPVTATTEEWEAALRVALGQPLRKLHLRPYADVVRDVLGELENARMAA